MKLPSIFNDVLGPVMRGPSSSHSAGALRIGRLVRQLMNGDIKKILVDRLIALGKQFDYFAYPNRDHGLWRGEGTTLHLRMLMTRYLLTHLPPGPR